MELLHRINDALVTARYYRDLSIRYSREGIGLPAAGLPASLAEAPVIDDQPQRLAA